MQMPQRVRDLRSYLNNSVHDEKRLKITFIALQICQLRHPFDNSIAVRFRYATMLRAEDVWDEKQDLYGELIRSEANCFCRAALTLHPVALRFKLR